MGNWRTVNIVGTCAPAEVRALRHALDHGEDYENFHPLCNTSGLCGLGDWAAERIKASGNLAERDYTVESVATTLRKLVTVAPSLAVKVHCGGDYESTDCIATVTAADGEVTVGPAEVKTLDVLSEAAITARVYTALMGRPR